MTVLLTGAAGAIGTTLRAALPERGWQLRSLDRAAVDDPGPGDVTGELTDPDVLDRALAGCSAVVHLAGVPTEAPWAQLREANVDGVVALFAAARRHGVSRVVLASSNHATGFTPNTPDLPADAAPRPDTFYGVTKVFAEALGRYHHDRYGMAVACLRIGTFADRPTDARSLATWLSPGDCVRLVDACLRSPDLGYDLVWGVSANTRRTWDLTPGRRLGYEPQDDAEAFAAQVAAAPRPSDALVGGGFTEDRFDIDRIEGDVAT